MFRNKQRAERNKNKYKNFHFDFVTDPNAINLAEDSKIKTLKKDKTGLPPIPRSTNHKTKNANFIKKNNHWKCCIQNRQKWNNTCQSQSNLNYNSRNRFEVRVISFLWLIFWFRKSKFLSWKAQSYWRNMKSHLHLKLLLNQQKYTIRSKTRMVLMVNYIFRKWFC